MDYSYNSNFVNELYQDILKLITTSDIEDLNEDKFNDLALREFAYQFFNNKFYRNHCEDLGIKNPTEAGQYTEIPVVPTDFFKKHDIFSFPESLLPHCCMFVTSGTTFGTFGKIWRDPKSMELYDAAYLRTAKEYFFPDLKEGERMISYFLTSPPKDVPNSNIAHNNYLSEKHFGTVSKYFMDREGYHVSEVIKGFREIEKANEPVAIKATAFSTLLLLDKCKEAGISFRLPEGSRCGYGGGFKGLSREISKEELLHMVEDGLGILSSYSLDLLAHSEHPTIYYDNALRNRFLGRNIARYKLDLPWTRTVIVTPETYENPKKMRIVDKNEKGYLCHYDLTDMGSVIGIVTNDFGIKVGSGFEILGRKVPYKITVPLKLI